MSANTTPLHRERGLLFLGFICIALLAGALWMHYVEHEDPCPLCIIQRYCVVLIGLFAFISARLRSQRGIIHPPTASTY